LWKFTTVLLKQLLFLFLLSTFSILAQKELIEVKKFGTNPGKLKLFIHAPKNAKNSSLKIPLVIVLHGCSQSAESIAKLTEWNRLSDKYGFYVMYPQQNLVNNPSLCFNWFNSDDVSKDKGEAHSIQQMTDFITKNYPIDNERIFVYGVSAGAAMSVVLMSNYPQMINAGASLAGGPFMPELNDLQRMETMFKPKELASEKLAQPIERLNTNFKGNYPRMIVVQGKNDMVVNPKNADLLIAQWSYLHKVVDSMTISSTNFNESTDVTQIVYRNSEEEPKIIYYEINRMGHVIPIDPGSLPNQGGIKTMLSLDKDFFSTYFIAKDFGLIPEDE